MKNKLVLVLIATILIFSMLTHADESTNLSNVLDSIVYLEMNRTSMDSTAFLAEKEAIIASMIGSVQSVTINLQEEGVKFMKMGKKYYITYFKKRLEADLAGNEISDFSAMYPGRNVQIGVSLNVIIENVVPGNDIQADQTVMATGKIVRENDLDWSRTTSGDTVILGLKINIKATQYRQFQ